jgi:hypothetical protein
MFAFIIDHKLSVVKVVFGLMQSIWSKVLGFMIVFVEDNETMHRPNWGRLLSYI